MSNERGFTLPELMVATVGLVVLFGIAALMLAPVNYTYEQMDARRKLDLAVIAQGVHRYVTEIGEAPPFIPAEPLVIGNSTDNEYDLCVVLTADYLPVLPLEPKQGTVINEGGEAQNARSVDCDEPGAVYSTGYSIAQDESGAVLVSTILANGQVYSLPVPRP